MKTIIIKFSMISNWCCNWRLFVTNFLTLLTDWRSESRRSIVGAAGASECGEPFSSVDEGATPSDSKYSWFVGDDTVDASLSSLFVDAGKQTC